METFLARIREVANAIFAKDDNAQLTKSHNLPIYDQAMQSICPTDFAMFVEKENVNSLNNSVEEDNDKYKYNTNRYRDFVYQLIDAYNDTNGINEVEESKSVNVYQQFVLKALALCLHTLSHAIEKQFTLQQATNKLTGNHKTINETMYNNTINEDDNIVITRDVELLTGEDALMVALFVSELMTVDDQLQFRYLCECISSLHYMYVHFKYMSNINKNWSTPTYGKESFDSSNNNYNRENDENIESLSVELRALQTTLTSKCNHHSIFVQLSATKALCNMFTQSLQVANYLGIDVGVDVSARLSSEIASLTTQTFAPLTNATLNMSGKEEHTSLHHAKNENNHHDDDSKVIDNDNNTLRKEQTASATLVTVIECIEQMLWTSITLPTTTATTQSQSSHREHALVESNNKSSKEDASNTDIAEDNTKAQEKMHHVKEEELQRQKYHKVCVANVEYVLQRLLRILQSYLSAEPNKAAMTENAEVDQSLTSMMQTSNSHSKHSQQKRNVSNNALQIFAVKHAIRRMLSIVLHLSDNANTTKNEVNMLMNTLPLSLPLREALSAALSAFGGSLPHEEIAILTHHYNANFCINNNYSSDHIRSEFDSHTGNSDNMNATRRELEMSELESWYVNISNNIQEAAEGNKRVWPVSDDILTSVNCDAVLAKVHKLHKLRQHRSAMRYGKHKGEEESENSENDDVDEEINEEEDELNLQQTMRRLDKYDEKEANMNSEDESIDVNNDDATQTTNKDGQTNVNNNNSNEEAKGGLLIIEEGNEEDTFSTTGDMHGDNNNKKNKTVIRTSLDFNVTPTLLVEMVLMSLSQLPLLSESEIQERHLQGLTLMQYNAASLAQQEEVKRVIAMERAGVEAIPASQLLWQVNEGAKLHHESLAKLRRHDVQAALMLAAFRSVLSSYVYMRSEREAVIRSTQTLIARCLLHLPPSVVDMAMDEMLLMLYNEVILTTQRKEIESQHESTPMQSNLETNFVLASTSTAATTTAIAAKARNEWASLQGRVSSLYNCVIQVLFVSYATQAPVHDRVLHSLFDMNESNNVLMTTSPQTTMINTNTNNLQPSQVKNVHTMNSNNSNNPDTLPHQSTQQGNADYSTSTSTSSFLSHLRNQNQTHQEQQQQGMQSFTENTAMLNIEEPIAFLRDNDVHIAAHELGKKRPRDNFVNNINNSSVASVHHSSTTTSSSSLPSLHSSFTFLNDTMYNVSLYSSFLCRVIEVMQSAKCTTLLLDVLLQAPSLTRSVWYYLYKEYCLNVQNKTRIVLGIWILTHIARRRAPYKECAVQLLLQLATSVNEYARRLAIKQIGALLPSNQELSTSSSVQSTSTLANTNLQNRMKLNECITAAEEMQIMQFAERQLALIPSYYLSSVAIKMDVKREIKNEKEEEHKKEDESNAAGAKEEETSGSNAHKTEKLIENNASLRKEVKRLELALNRHLGLFLMLCYRHPASLFASLLSVYKQCIDLHNDAMAHLLTRNTDVIKLIQHLISSQPTVFLSTVMPLLRRYSNSSPLLVQSFLHVISAHVEEMAVAAATTSSSTSASASTENYQQEQQQQSAKEEVKYNVNKEEPVSQSKNSKNAMIHVRQIALAILSHVKAMYESSIIPLGNGENNSDEDDDNDNDEENNNYNMNVVSKDNDNDYSADKLFTQHNKRLRADSKEIYNNLSNVNNKNVSTKTQHHHKQKDEFVLHDIRFIAPFLSYVASQDVKSEYLRSFLYFVQLQLQTQREKQITLQNNSREGEEHEINVFTHSTKERLHTLSSLSELHMFIGSVIRQLVVKSPIMFDDGVARGISRVELFVLLHRITQEPNTKSNETNKHDASSNSNNNTMTTLPHSILGVPPLLPTSETTQIPSSLMTANSILPLRNIENSNMNNINANMSEEGILGNAEPLPSHTSDYIQSLTSSELRYSHNTSNNLYERKVEQHLQQEPERLNVQHDPREGVNSVTTNVLPPISVVTTKKVIEVCLLLHRNFNNLNKLIHFDNKTNNNNNNEVAERLYGVEEVQKAILKMMHMTSLPPSQLMSTILLSAASFSNNALLAPQVSSFIRFVIHNVLLPLQHIQIWSKSARLWKGVLIFMEHYYQECSSLLVNLPDSVLITALHEQPTLAENFRKEHGNNASFSHILASV